MNVTDAIALRDSDTQALRGTGGRAETARAGRTAARRAAPPPVPVDIAGLDRRIDAACERIAPLWPLKHFVAVNPFFGLRDQTFQAASDTLARIVDTSLYMPRAYYREQLASGRIARADLEQAIRRCGSRLDAEANLFKVRQFSLKYHF